MATQTSLQYGCRHQIEGECHAFWGARLIYDEVMRGGKGIVPDRVDMDGEDAAKEHLLAALNESVGNKAMDKARELHRNYSMQSSSDELWTLYDDGEVIVIGSPQKSYGYLYVTAGLR